MATPHYSWLYIEDSKDIYKESPCIYIEYSRSPYGLPLGTS